MRVQTFGDWEAIVVDDHSQDRSLELAQRYARLDSRIRAVSRLGDRKGANSCRNQGLSIARGDYAIFLDSDDLLAESCLEHRVAAMDDDTEWGFGVFQTEIFTKSIGDRRLLWNTFTQAEDLRRFLSMDVVWLTTGPIWRRQTILQLGGFDEGLISYQDWELNVRALIARINYFKENTRDSFYRKEYDGGQISAVSHKNTEHLQAHEEMLRKTVFRVQEAGLFDQDNRCRLAGLFWRLAMFWAREAQKQNATRAWRNAKHLGLCGVRHYLEGRLILKLHALRKGRRFGGWIQRFWPPQYTTFASKHLCNTPIAHAEPAARFVFVSEQAAPSISANEQRI